MPKNWRLAVCRRSRLVLALASLVISCLLMDFAFTAFEKYQAFNLEQKIERIKVGMSEEELVQIVGRPPSGEVMDESPVFHLRRLHYSPKWLPLRSGRYRWWVITLDAEADKITEISLEGGLVEVDLPPEFKWIVLGAILGVALAIWLLVLRWCSRIRGRHLCS